MTFSQANPTASTSRICSRCHAKTRRPGKCPCSPGSQAAKPPPEGDQGRRQGRREGPDEGGGRPERGRDEGPGGLRSGVQEVDSGGQAGYYYPAALNKRQQQRFEGTELKQKQRHSDEKANCNRCRAPH